MRPDHLLLSPLVFVAGIALLPCGGLLAQREAWTNCAPEDLPPVTVRWEDHGQREVFVVEGAEYECRVATLPARVLSLRVRGKDLLGPEGMGLAFEDAAGVRYAPAPAEVTPNWMTWQGQDYKPANGSRARMNVWSAGPNYWDAHLLDIPLMSDEALWALRDAPETPALARWDFGDDLEGWERLERCSLAHDPAGLMRITLTGPDPFMQSPELDIDGPVVVAMRLRCTTAPGAAFYWTCEGDGGYAGDKVQTFGIVPDGEWHQYRVTIPAAGKLNRLRFDPPGELGLVEVDWLRLQAPDDDARAPKPARGEVVFHAFPDQLRVEFRVEQPEGAAVATTAVLTAPGLTGTASVLDGRGLLTVGDPAAGLLGVPGSTCGDGVLRAPLTGSRPGACWVLRPLAPGQAAWAAFVNDLRPLPATAFQVTGGHARGYDPFSGLYLVDASLNLGAFGFEPAYKNPSRRTATGVQLANDDQPRNVTLKCMTGVGNLEAAVVTDPAGFPLPVPAFVCKNFGGEREEPDDSGFGDSYVPLSFAAGQRREFQVLHLVQDWGNHPLKQVSSIRFFHIYWHLSTGAHETTCFTHNWMQHGTGIFQIPDFRPMSGEMWADQPQHGVGQWPGWLQYNDARVKLVYERTTFESISPCLSRFTMHYHSSDDAATATVGVMEVPQRDELRTFLKLRYDWQEPVRIEGDARESFRWLNMNERQGADRVLWTDAEGKLQSMAVAEGESQPLGVSLARRNAVLGAHGKGDGEDYHSLVLVRSFKARLGGRDLDTPAGSFRMGADNGDYWFGVTDPDLALQPGDFIEAEVMLMPHGDPVPWDVKPQRERERFGEGGPDVLVEVGERLSGFPATIRAQGEVARFALTGGFDLMPVIVSGFQGWGVPLLWRDGVWQDQQVHGGDGYQVERDGDGGYRFIFAYPTRKGQQQNLMVTRAECSAGIARVYDVNGMVALDAVAEGRFRLKAPALFGAGVNVVRAGAPAYEFSGEGRSVRQLPLGVDLPAGEATVEVIGWSGDEVRLRTRGDALTLHVGQLNRGAEYAVTTDGAARTVVAADGSLRLPLPAGEHAVTVTRQ